MYRKLLALVIVSQLVACATIVLEVFVDDPPQLLPLQPLIRSKHPVLGLALGGGATRGFAHVGVLNTLEQNGIMPDIVTGTSAGAVTGVLFASGIRGAKLEEIAKLLQRDQVVDWSYSGRGFIRGELLQRYINRLLDNRPIEKLPMVFAATTTDLESGELAVFTRGNAGLAVRASSTIPGLVSPVTINGRDYVDGGLVAKVPVLVTRQLGADIVIAIDVSRPPREHPDLDNTVSVMQQAMTILSQAVLERDLSAADVVIRPDLGYVTLGDFEFKDMAIKAGEQAALAAIPSIKRALIKRRKTD